MVIIVYADNAAESLCTHTYIYTCIYIHTYIHIYIYTYIYIYPDICDAPLHVQTHIELATVPLQMYGASSFRSLVTRQLLLLSWAAVCSLLDGTSNWRPCCLHDIRCFCGLRHSYRDSFTGCLQKYYIQ